MTRKISALEETISVANQCNTEEVKRGKTLFGYKRKYKLQFLQKLKKVKNNDSLSSKLNEKNEKLANLKVRNFNMDRRGKTKNENFIKENN